MELACGSMQDGPLFEELSKLALHACIWEEMLLCH